MVERFRALLENLGLTASEFADRIGVQRSSMSHVLSGRNKPSIEFLEKILLVFPDIDATWLITGRTGSAKIASPVENTAVKDNSQLKLELEPVTENKKPPALSAEEPVDHIIIVYKNNTFRYLNPFEG